MFKAKYVITIVLILSSFMGQTQFASRLVREANMMYDNENYCEATEKLEAAYKQLSRKGKKSLLRKGIMSYKVAESYRKTERFNDAIEWYERAELLEYEEKEPRLLYFLAVCYSQIADEEKSTKYIEKYEKFVPADPMSEILKLTLKE